MWGDYESIQKKKMNHLTPLNDTVSKNALFAWRVFAFVIMLVMMIMQWILHSRYDVGWSLQYFTIWNLYITAITFSLLLIAHLKETYYPENSNL